MSSLHAATLAGCPDEPDPGAEFEPLLPVVLLLPPPPPPQAVAKSMAVSADTTVEFRIAYPEKKVHECCQSACLAAKNFTARLFLSCYASLKEM
jgi:hypothetical protein